METRNKTAGAIFTANILLEITFVSAVVAGPAFQRIFDLSKTELGICFGMLNLGQVIFAPIVGNIIHRTSPSRIAILGLLGLSVGAMVITAASGMAILFAGLALIGIFATFIANANSTLLSNLFQDKLRRIMALASALWFSSSVIWAPVVGVWLETAERLDLGPWGFRVPLLLGICLIAGCIPVFLRFVSRFETTATLDSEKGGSLDNPIPWRRWIWILALGFCHGLLLVVLMSWLNPLVQTKFGGTETQGALAYGMLMLGLGAGRFVLAFVNIRWDDRLLIAVGGFAYSSVLPGLLTLIGSRFAPIKAKLFGYFHAAVSTAGFIGPPLVGLMADRGVSLSTALIISPAAAIALCVISLIWRHRSSLMSPAV